MNPNKYPDITSYKKELADKLWEALEAKLESSDLATINCLKPECGDSAEAINRKHLGLVTVASILYVRTAIGSETVTEALAAVNPCSC